MYASIAIKKVYILFTHCNSNNNEDCYKSDPTFFIKWFFNFSVYLIAVPNINTLESQPPITAKDTIIIPMTVKTYPKEICLLIEWMKMRSDFIIKKDL